MSLLDRISVDSAIRFGKPCLRGSPVGDVLGYLAAGESEALILQEFPQLKPEDIRACLAYAAERERRGQGHSGGLNRATALRRATVRGVAHVVAEQIPRFAARHGARRRGCT